MGPKTQPQWPKNTPDRNLWRNNVTTSLHREIFIIHWCACIISMYVPNLEAIGPETWPQWPKNSPNRYLWRNNVTTSLCRETYVCAKFGGDQTKNTLCIYMYVINSRAIGPKTRPQWPKHFHDVTTPWRRCVKIISTASSHPPYPTIQPVLISRWLIERSRSLIYTFTKT